MTALDQAFIKAYMHQGAAPVVATLSSARPVRLAEALAEPPKQEASGLPTELQGDKLADAVAQALESPPARIRRDSTSRSPRGEATDSARRPTEPSVLLAMQGNATRAVATSLRTRAPASQAARGSAAPSLTELGISGADLASRQPGSEIPIAVPEVPQATVLPISPGTPEPARVPVVEDFHPALQVDRFVWSSGSARLATAAGEQLDRLADGMASRRRSDRSVVAVCGCRRGDGCTTLLLCVARRLAAQGRRVLMLDADFDQPVLARRLGLLPEIGWEDVLWRGLPLAEAVIESVDDGLAVLPLRGVSPVEAREVAADLDPMSDIDSLRRHYDLILVDMGRFDFSSHRATAVLQSAGQWIDSVVVVHNVRTTPQTELDYVRRRLRELGLAEAGIAENFV